MENIKKFTNSQFMHVTLTSLASLTSLAIIYKSIKNSSDPQQQQQQQQKQGQKRGKQNNNLPLEQYAIGIEVGGTGISVGYGKKTWEMNDNNRRELKNVEIIEKKYFRTQKDPQKSIEEICEYIKQFKYQYIGIGSFGPLCLNKEDEDYGKITTTPKEGWRQFDLLKSIRQQLNYEGDIGFDTDVNACALGEYRLGKHSISNSLVYVTIGTGVGIGLIINGRPVHGMMHPEGGHMMIPKHKNDEGFTGVCSYHENCLEGLVTNVSIAKRKGLSDVMEVKNISDEDEIWDLIAHYLSVFCANIGYICSPEAIVLGGGIMKRQILYKKIQDKLEETFKGYLVLYKKTAEEFIQAPKCGENNGIVSAMII